MKLDLHMHTTRHSPDSQMDPFALVRRARDRGLDGIVITEHDRLWSPAEIEELQAAANGLLVLAGIEVSAREGHFLAYGVQDASRLPRGIGVADLCRAVHAQGGAVVAAHPFRWGQEFDAILEREQPDLDGLELMSKNMDADCRRRAAAIQQQKGLAGLGSSDAHAEAEVALCYTLFTARIRDGRDLVEAIRSRGCRPIDRCAERPA